MLVVLATLTLAIVQPDHIEALRLPKLYKNEMVLQATPTKAVIWGFLDGNTNEVQISASCVLKDGTKTLNEQKFKPKADDDKFQFEVPNGEHTRCSFTFIQEGADNVVLDDVIYGDVWVCSGQSNMQWGMQQIYNASEEIADIANYPNIRLYMVKMMVSDEPQEDLMEEQFTAWAKSSESDKVGPFSAVCLLTIKYMADVLGKDKVFGLIETNWGGTIIEAWMSKKPLDECDVGPTNNVDGPNRNSVLYNAMIHPLIRTSIKGALWYQGEANAGWNRDKYQCTFPAMIINWRSLWADNSGTSNTFPFGFMQLSTWQANDNSPGFPVIRWHQTADMGYVPNGRSGMNNVFMGVALDTYDEESGIHPRNKQLVSKRLAVAGLNVAYENGNFPSNGPFPITLDIVETGSGYQVDILYDRDFVWNPDEIDGFYICAATSAAECNNRNDAWWSLRPGSISFQGRSLSFEIPSTSTALAYLWKTTPVLKTGNLPIYADDEFGLPGAPWVQEIKKN